MSDQPSTQPVPVVPTAVTPSGFRSGWNMTNEQASSLANRLVESGVDRERVVAAAKQAGYAVAEQIDERTPGQQSFDRTFSAPVRAEDYRVPYLPDAHNFANDPEIAAALNDQGSIVDAMKAGALTMGLPASIGASVIADAIEDAAAYSRMSPDERRMYDVQQEAQFAKLVPDLATAKQQVAELVGRWHAANPVLVNALLRAGLFKSSRTFGQLALAAKRAAIRSTLK